MRDSGENLMRNHLNWTFKKQTLVFNSFLTATALSNLLYWLVLWQMGDYYMGCRPRRNSLLLTLSLEMRFGKTELSLVAG